MAELKTKKTAASVPGFLASVTDDERRKDCETLVRMISKATNAKPAMWGLSIVGFGTYKYKYPNGREMDWFQAGFSPRKKDLTVYLTTGTKPFPQLLKKLGKHKTGGSCLYFKRLSDVDLGVLQELIDASIARSRAVEGK